MAMMNNNENLEKFQKELVEKFIKTIEQDDLHWIKSWSSSDFPYNPTTGKEYSGTNVLILSMAQAALQTQDGRFCTFEQAKKQGWKIKKGEKSCPIIKFMFYDKETKKEWNQDVLKGMTEQEAKEYVKENKKSFIRPYRVFNALQIEGIPKLENKIVNNDDIKNETVEEILNNNPAKLVYGGSIACYNPLLDIVSLPNRENFIDNNSFYTTALHEIAHSTGHKSRLNRDLSGGFGSERYAKEELKAELASVLMAKKFGISIDEKKFESHSAYLKSWLSACKKDSSYLFDCLIDGNKIVNFVEKNNLKSNVVSNNESLLHNKAVQNVSKKLQKSQDKPFLKGKEVSFKQKNSNCK